MVLTLPVLFLIVSLLLSFLVISVSVFLHLMEKLPVSAWVRKLMLSNVNIGIKVLTHPISQRIFYGRILNRIYHLLINWFYNKKVHLKNPDVCHYLDYN